MNSYTTVKKINRKKNYFETDFNSVTLADLELSMHTV